MSEAENSPEGGKNSAEESLTEEVTPGEGEDVVMGKDNTQGRADHPDLQLGDESSSGSDNVVDAGVEEDLQTWEEDRPVFEEGEGSDQVTAVRFAQLEEAVPQVKKNVHMLDNVIVDICVELGRKTMSVRQLTEIKEQDVIELDKLAGEAFDIRVNGRLFAKGEVVVVTDLMAVRITTLHSNPDTQRTEVE